MSHTTNLGYTHLEDVYMEVAGFSLIECVLICRIKSMTENDKACYIAQDRLADIYGVTRKCINENLGHLVDIGILKVECTLFSKNNYVYNKEFDDMKRLIEVGKTQTQSEKNKQKLITKYNLEADVVEMLIDWSDIPRVKFRKVPYVTSKSFADNSTIVSACKELQKLDHETQVNLIKTSVEKNWASINYEWFTNANKPYKVNDKSNNKFDTQGNYDSSENNKEWENEEF